MKTILLEQLSNPQYSPAKAKTEKNYRIAPHIYAVTRLGNSTTPSIGDVLQKREVDALCAKTGWKVTINGQNAVSRTMNRHSRG